MPAYRRKLKKGERWYFRSSYLGLKYCSKAIFLTKSETKKAEADHIKKMDEEVRNPKPRMTLYELCNKRLDFLKTKSDKYYNDNQRLFKKIIKKWGWNSLVSSIRKPIVYDFLLAESKRLIKAGKTNSSVNHDLRYLKALFEFAIEMELMEVNPTRKIKPYPVKKELYYIPPELHLQMVCEWCLPHQQKLIVFVKETACRISEALRVKGGDVDADRGLLALWTKKKRYGDLTPRRILLPEAVKKMKQKGLLFPEFTQYPRFIEKACKELEIPVFGWHTYRHLKASQMAMDGVPLIQISSFLGHESIVITQKYLHHLGFIQY